MRALFLSPHPDDAELFCGGTVAALAERGEVILADMTRGEMSSNGTIEGRAMEAAEAARTLGVVEPRLQLGLPDAALDVRDQVQVRAVVEVIRRLVPDLVFAPWPVDRHPDHVATGEIARRSVAIAAGPTRLLFYPCHGEIEPTLLIDVSAVIGRWESAVRCYASQFLSVEGVRTPINRPGFLEHHLNRRVRWGSLRGVEFAEGLIHEGPWPVDVDQLGGQ